MQRGSKRSRKFTYGGRKVVLQEKLTLRDRCIDAGKAFFFIGFVCVAYVATVISLAIAGMYIVGWLFVKAGPL